MTSLEKIRSTFLNYFRKNDHKIMDSSPLTPFNDESLLFTNAGMVQFKDWFVGLEQPKYKNIATSQKCLRAGGKHNDLENVGYTPRHHTFFEMLGNFSFDSYFKEEAIELAWNFLIKELDIDKKRLVITVFNNDLNSYKIWKKISNFSESQIIKISSDDNFWSMGDSGPCGPCSEIFFDNGSKLNGGLPGTKQQDGDRYIEIWNLVFMQYEKKNNEFFKLPIKCVDTGMGLERLTSVLNGYVNNYDINIFKDIISSIEKLTQKKVTNENKISFRVISDHIRSIIFLIAEGILPSNEGRGYVLRRIIRRASRHLSFIGYEKPLLYKLADIFCEKYKETYTELALQKKIVTENLRLEEEKFLETLTSGLKLLKQEIASTKNNDFSSETAFKLYDTYGFPIDLTQTILREKKINLNLEEIELFIKDQKNKSKGTWRIVNHNSDESLFKELKNKFKITNFTGYTNYQEKSKLLAIIEGESFLKKTSNSKNLILIFDKSPFYAESGGQIGDKGKIFINQNEDEICEINQTKKRSQFHLHFCEKIRSELVVGDSYFLKIDKNHRMKARNNHTATHLIHEALRMTLGKHVKQKGSYVSSEKLRFDFTNNFPMSKNQVNTVENLVNDVIRRNYKVDTKLMDYDKALKSGAIGLFGEKYSDEVRVISLGEKRTDFSFVSSELCGGTHVDFTGEIGSIRILNETSVSSGVRRIEAITGKENDKLNLYNSELLQNLKAILKTNDENIINKVENLVTENIRLKKTNVQKKHDEFNSKYLKKINEISVYIEVCNMNVKDLKNYSDNIKTKIVSGLIVLISKLNNKVTIVLSISDDLISKYDASKMIRDFSTFFGGKGGGGRRDLAQGGGSDLSKIPKVEEFINMLLNN